MSTALDRLQLPDNPLAPKFAGILGSAMDDKVIVDLLGQVGNLFTSSLELKETIDFMLKAAADLVDCDAATVFLLEEDGRALSAIATYPFTDNLGQVARFELGEGIVGWAAQRRKLVSVADATKDRRFKTLGLAYAPRSCLVMPLEFAATTRRRAHPCPARGAAVHQHRAGADADHREPGCDQH